MRHEERTNARVRKEPSWQLSHVKRETQGCSVYDSFLAFALFFLLLHYIIYTKPTQPAAFLVQRPISCIAGLERNGKCSIAPHVFGWAVHPVAALANL